MRADFNSEEYGLECQQSNSLLNVFLLWLIQFTHEKADYGAVASCALRCKLVCTALIRLVLHGIPCHLKWYVQYRCR